MAAEARDSAHDEGNLALTGIFPVYFISIIVNFFKRRRNFTRIAYGYREQLHELVTAEAAELGGRARLRSRATTTTTAAASAG